jgi:N6-adenosine-specific RNA methylase IME4
MKRERPYEARVERGGTVVDLHALAVSGRRYSVIYADPPWDFKQWSKKGNPVVGGHYDTMSVDKIKSLPVGRLAGKECVLLLWTTWPHLLHALEVIKAWGFEYKTAGFVWAKQTPNSKGWHMGNGYYTRSNTEPCLLATPRRGSQERDARDVHQLIVAPVCEHSRKPDEVHERIEQLFVGPYVELFARTERPGWTTWGNEVAAESAE